MTADQGTPFLATLRPCSSGYAWSRLGPASTRRSTASAAIRNQTPHLTRAVHSRFSFKVLAGVRSRRNPNLTASLLLVAPSSVALPCRSHSIRPCGAFSRIALHFPCGVRREICNRRNPLLRRTRAPDSPARSFVRML